MSSVAVPPDGICSLVWIDPPVSLIALLLNFKNPDEQARLLLVLKSTASEDQLKQLLPHLEIKLAAHATDAVPQGSGNAAAASGKHDLTSLVVAGADTISLTSAEGVSYAVWQPRLHLPRPRVKLQRPAVYFTAYLTLTHEARAAAAEREWNTLKPYEPLPRNLLAALHFDPHMAEYEDYVSSDSLTQQPGTRSQEETKPLRAASKRALPIIPALFTRTRYTNLADATIASVYVETSRLISGTLSLHDFNVDISDAKAEELSTLQLPIEARAGDELVALYKLTSRDMSRAKKAPVAVKMQAKLSRPQRADVDIDFTWQTSADLSHIAPRTNYRWSRPLSSGGQHSQRRSIKDAQQPQVAGVNQPVRQKEAGVRFSFSAPRIVSLKDTFRVKVLCVNDTDRVKRFTLVAVLDKRHTNKERIHAQDQKNVDVVARFFNTPPLESILRPDVQDVEPDVRMGPVPAEGFWEINMKFRANKTGPLDLGTIRIVDLDSRRTVDVKDLPDVVALDLDPDEVNALRRTRDGADQITVLDADEWDGCEER